MNFESHTLEVPGGTLDYRLYGQGERYLVICNGYGADYDIWNGVLADLEKDFRILMWDYRATYRSEFAANASVTISDQAWDLYCLMEKLEIREAAILAWSVGVQVALEFYCANPQRVTALCLHDGTHDHLLHRLFGQRHWNSSLRVLVAALRKVSPVLWPKLQPLARKLGQASWFVPLCEKLRLVRGNPEGFSEAYASLVDLDMSTYLQMALDADDHDLHGALSKIQVPTLVMFGTRDMLTPLSLAKKLVRSIPNAKEVLLPNGTHYTLLECPHLLALSVKSFLDGVKA